MAKKSDDSSGNNDGKNVSGDGKQPAPSGNEELKFTQEQFDAHLKERLAREQAKHADYDELKAKAEAWEEYEETQKSELEKAQDRAEQAEQAQTKALQEANKRLLRGAVLGEAGKLRVKFPEDAFRLVDLKSVQLQDDGSIVGADVAVKALVDSGRIATVGKPAAPDLDGGAGGGDGDPPDTGVAALTADELEMAKNLNMTPEDYAKYK